MSYIKFANKCLPSTSFESSCPASEASDTQEASRTLGGDPASAGLGNHRAWRRTSKLPAPGPQRACVARAGRGTGRKRGAPGPLGRGRGGERGTCCRVVSVRMGGGGARVCALEAAARRIGRCMPVPGRTVKPAAARTRRRRRRRARAAGDRRGVPLGG